MLLGTSYLYKIRMYNFWGCVGKMSWVSSSSQSPVSSLLFILCLVITRKADDMLTAALAAVGSRAHWE